MLLKRFLHGRRCGMPAHRYCDSCMIWECEARPHLGYEVPERVALLTFQGSDYQGAEVRVLVNPSYETTQRLEATNGIEGLRVFGDRILVSWNLERDGRPVPADAHHFIQQPAEFSDLIALGWTQYYTAQSTPAPVDETVQEPESPPEPLDEYDRPLIVGDLDLERFQKVTANGS